MAVISIDCLNDPRLAPYRDLPEREGTRGLDLIVAEGELLVRRLLDSPLETVSVLTAEKRAAQVAPYVPEAVPLYVVPNAMVHEIVGYRFHSGAIACGRRPAPPSLESLVSDVCTLAVCPKIINVANVGSIVRVCAALGASALVLGEESCDAFIRQAVRVSMGAVFSLPIYHSDELHRDLKHLQDAHDFELVAAVAGADAQPLPGAHRRLRTALLFGAEDHGLDDRTLALCDRRMTIPMRDDIDSLNVAMAAAVVLYHFTRAAPEIK